MSSITTRRGDYYGDATDNLTWEITDEQGIAAELYIHAEHHMIMNLTVRENRRGEGLARALYEAADATATIFHAPEWACSPEGAAFAEAMGGETISDDLAREITGANLDFLTA